MLRRLTRHPRFLALAARLLGLYLSFVYRTTRWTLEGEAVLETLRREPGPLILAFWHERIALASHAWIALQRAWPDLRTKRPQVLVSRHRDGVFIGQVVGRFHIDVIHGSTSRGGVPALRAMLRILRRGDVAVITPDGPRGPRRVAAAGVGQLAAMSGAPVLPYTAAVTRYVQLRSWDRMILPLPFGRGILLIHPPLRVPPDGAEAGRLVIEEALTEVCEAADAWVAERRAGRHAGKAALARRDVAGRESRRIEQAADAARRGGSAP
jgi:lysophospholipid acyltransferase (LPLAT)-like uncharacterized protein